MLAHQLLVACQEHHAAAVRQERLIAVRTKHAQRDEARAAAPLAAAPSRRAAKAAVAEKQEPAAPQQGMHHTSCHTGSPAPVVQPQSQRCAASPPDQPRPLPAPLLHYSPCAAGIGLDAAPTKDADSTAKHQYRYHRTECVHEAPTAQASQAAAPHAWLPYLAQEVHNLALRTQKNELALETSKRDSSAMFSDAQAHLRVLESRVLALERRQWHPPTGTLHQPGEPSCPTVPPVAPHVSHSNDKKKPMASEQTWVRWDSPSAPNPLSTQQWQQQGGAAWAIPPPERAFGSTEGVGGSHSGTSPVTSDVFDSGGRKSSSRSLSGGGSGSGGGGGGGNCGSGGPPGGTQAGLAGIQALLNTLNARVLQAEGLIASVRQAVY